MAKRREKTGIYIDLQHLFRIIYAGQFEMNKRDRACIMADTIKELLAINSNFSLSYIEEDKMKYIIRMIAAFENLKFILRFCIDDTGESSEVRRRYREMAEVHKRQSSRSRSTRSGQNDISMKGGYTVIYSYILQYP